MHLHTCCACSLCCMPSLPSIPSACTVSWTFTWDADSHPWQPPLTGNHGLASAAWAVTSLLLVLYLLWGFPFPGPAGELGCACMSLHWILTRDVWFYPSILLTALGDLNLFLLWWMLSLLGKLWPYLSVKSASTLFGCAVAGVVLVCDGLVCNVLLLKWETNLRMVVNTVEEKAQITKFNGNPGFLMVTCCANSRFICFLINQKECSFYFSHLVESMLFSFLLLQIGATQEKGCFNFCFWLVFQGWVSIEHVKTYCIQLQSSALKDCKNLT